MSFFTPDQIASLNSSLVRLDVLAELQFESQTVHLWNGNSDLKIGGDTYRPTRGAARIDGLGVSGGTVSESVTFTLNGLPNQDPDLLGLALSETPDVEQQFMITSLVFFVTDDDSPDAWQPIDSPLGIFWGFMQPPKVTRTPMQGAQGGAQSIALTAENAFYNRSKPPNGRCTDRDQQLRSPGDKFFQFTVNLLFKTFVYPDF